MKAESKIPSSNLNPYPLACIKLVLVLATSSLVPPPLHSPIYDPSCHVLIQISVVTRICSFFTVYFNTY